MLLVCSLHISKLTGTVSTAPRHNTYLVKMNGMRCPTCMASEEGPLPV